MTTTTTEPTPTPAPAAARTNPAAKAWASFQENSADHQLTVLHEHGLYRHIRMAEPGTRMWSWDIVTWPGHLATSGDIADGLNLTEFVTSADGLTFSREPDMIRDFFGRMRGNRPYYADGAPSLDFRYWAEKLQGDQRQTAKAYVHENFIRFVTETLTERREDGYDASLTQERVDELIDEVKQLEEYEAAARDWLAAHDDEFPDSWENDFKDYTFHFQVACYAINAAVQAYLARPLPSAEQ
ncbi:hypothetical protein [Arthrobacter sp. ES1]|uniref:hypothetical protein n=1 Tax=Arthrobacter sp. ES1 TaxID=1897056 RepID=UPI001CFFB45E|nr:hypothetical protein [Arthrobacter sp. ES1]MCB5280482.1 hypothetical protein [Arthrobacter sp. ES1]